MRIYFSVSFDLPPGASKTEALHYLRDSVKSWCGGLNPDNPMFNLERRSVRAMTRLLKEGRKRGAYRKGNR